MSKTRANPRKTAPGRAVHLQRTRAPSKPRKPRGKVGGARPNSGPDPVLGPGNVRSVIKTVRLTPLEEQAQIGAAKRAGAKDWGTWIRDLANAAASRDAQGEILATMQAAGVTAVPYGDDIALGGELHIEGSKALELGRRVGAAVEKVLGKPARDADPVEENASLAEHGRQVT